jgi:hypothetical protein
MRGTVVKRLKKQVNKALPDDLPEVEYKNDVPRRVTSMDNKQNNTVRTLARCKKKYYQEAKQFYYGNHNALYRSDRISGLPLTF